MNTAHPPKHVGDLLERIQGGSEFDYLLFWGHRARADGQVSASCFSQWFPAPFIVEGDRYLTAEHFMMAGKARLFDDAAALARVLAAVDPGAAKAVGRQVRGFDEATWQAHRFDIVVRANRAKFAQHPAMAEYLLRTGDQVLVEASPFDTIWGIGLSASHDRARDPSQWRGLNLLGFALMQVRAELRAA
ncbi:NADAR family protein [Ideonella sp. DXS29W]|uniref:NADAR family protein n=1 Tax=Ideonella lacteola TaxID=2984193 RepID=A0ABU9BKF5_9BURK